MFYKIVSNLPFSPSLVGQLGFYAKRLQKEQFTRKLGLVFTAIFVVVQTMTFISPPKPTLAASGNDIIFGGAGKTSNGIVSAYKKNTDSLGHKDIQAIFNAYGINNSNINSYKSERIYSSSKNNYWSIGRNPRGYGSEKQVQIPGGPRIYSRTLHGWQANAWWDAIRFETNQGTRWILLECGNIVTQNTPPVQPPDVTIEKSVNKQRVKTGEKIVYTLKVTNKGRGSAKDVLVYDDSPVGVDLLNDGLGSDPIKSARRWQTSKRFDMAPNQSYTYKIYARITATGPAILTNKACVDIFDANVYNNCDKETVVVPETCPHDPKLPIDDPDCKTDPNLEIKKTTTNSHLKVGDTFTYDVEATNTGDVALPNVVVRDVAPTEVEFLQVKLPGHSEFKNLTNKREFKSTNFKLNQKQTVVFQLKAKVIEGSQDPVNNQACILSLGTDTTAGACDDEVVTIIEPCPTDSSLPKNNQGCQPPCQIEGKDHLPANSPDCQPCNESKQGENGKDISCLALHKTAKNITQGIEDANGTTAKPGDAIEYTLSVKNSGKNTRTDFVIEENVEDILEYADIIDASGGKYQSSPTKMVSWSPVDIKSGATASRTILIKIKGVLPNTPASTSDPLSYDFKLINVYGNKVQINLPKTPVKTIEQTVKMLPSTGFGANAAITAIMISVATYFYYRSRLMSKELSLVRSEFGYSGGTS
jgi:uncharacterized repeat protein (TIGR01451 family)